LSISLSPNTLANLSQIFSILSNLKGYRGLSQALGIIFQMQSQKSRQKRTVKILFFKLQNVFFGHFFSLLLHQCITFSFFYGFKLSDLNCSEMAILSFTNHLATLKATE